MTDPARLARAAHNILTRSLGLRRDQNLLIFADASSLEVVEVMARAARDLGIATSTLFVPRACKPTRGRRRACRCRSRLRSVSPTPCSVVSRTGRSTLTIGCAS